MAAPATPVVTCYALNSTSILATWTPCARADSYIVKRGVTTVSTETAVVQKTITGLTASTAYSITVTASNTDGDTVSAAVSCTTNAAKAFLTRINDTLVAYIESCTQALGYWYDYTTGDEPDLAKCTLSATKGGMWFNIVEETSVDADKACDNTAYHQNDKLIINSVASIGIEVENPYESYKVVAANMIEDLKKMFGSNTGLTAAGIAFWNEIANIEYVKSYINWKQHKDAMTPGVLVSEWKLSYAQLKTNPNSTAI